MKARLDHIVERIECNQGEGEAARREARASLIAVSKTKPREAVLEAYECGQRLFGENYVNELVEKASLCPSDIEWHFIGHLQSNKASAVARISNVVVQTVDSLKLAQRLSRARGELLAESRAVGAASGPGPLRVMIQVLTSDEESKSGVPAQDLVQLATSVSALPDLELWGLMTIGAPGKSRESFEELRRCRDEVEAAFAAAGGERKLRLSMGMSEDFELAVRLGADFVRVGSAIFGAREYKTEGAAAASAAAHSLVRQEMDGEVGA